MQLTNTFITLALLAAANALPIDKRALVTVTHINRIQVTVTAGADNQANTPIPTSTPQQVLQPSTSSLAPDTPETTQAASSSQNGFLDIFFGGSTDAGSPTVQPPSTAAITQAASSGSSLTQNSRDPFDFWSFIFGGNGRSTSTADTTSTPQTFSPTSSQADTAPTSSQADTAPTSTQADAGAASTGEVGILPASSSNEVAPASTTDSGYGSTSSSSSSALSDSEVEQVSSTDSSDTTNKLWGRFWSSDQGWNSNDNICGGTSYTEPSLWNQAVVGRAVTNVGDSSSINTVISQIENYKNSQLQVFSASTAKDTDIYTDDNAQVAWVYIDAYKKTHNQQYLSTAQNIVNYLMNQTDANGGVIWQYEHTYIASISTTEAALAAVRLYEITQDQNLLAYAEKLMNFMFKYLQDPSDHLFYDGLHSDDYSDMDKGKLSYTVGTAISTLAYLHKYTSNSYWHQQAISLADAATNTNGKLYNGDGIWNNQLQYSHLLFAGFADLFSIDDSGDADEYKSEVLRQASFVYNYLQDPSDVNFYFSSVSSSTPQAYSRYSKAYTGGGKSYSPSSSLYCPGSDKVKKSLMDNASVAQILYFTTSY